MGKQEIIHQYTSNLKLRIIPNGQ